MKRIELLSTLTVFKAWVPSEEYEQKLAWINDDPEAEVDPTTWEKFVQSLARRADVY